MPLVGLFIASYLTAFTLLIEVIEIAGLTLAAMLVIITVRFSNYFSNLATIKSHRIYILFFLPFLLSLDNLSAGFALHASGFMVLLLGGMAALTCSLGLVIGKWIKTHTVIANLKPGMLNAVCLAGVALYALIGELV